jgi:hypothetical protein
LNAVDVHRVLVEGDPAHITVAMGFWHQFFSQLLSVEELWLYPGTAEVLGSACVPRDAGRVLQSLKRVYVIEGRISVEPRLSRPTIASESDLDVLFSAVDLNASPSPPSDGSLIKWNRGEREEEDLHSLNVAPGLMALLRGGGVRSREVHLRNCEVEDGTLAALCALAKVRVDCEWI